MRHTSEHLVGIPVALLLFSTTCASAQLLRVGVAGGLPLTDVFNARTDPNQPVFQYLASPFQSATQRTVPYIVGPAVEVRLTSRFGIEVDALYSRGTYNYTEIFTRSPSLGSALQETKHAANLWDFPVLLKYRTSVRPGLRPFVGAGISVQYATDGVVESLFGTAGPVGRPFYFSGQRDGSTSGSTSTGATAVGGLEFGFGRMRISPQVRYTRWFNETIKAGGVILPGRVLDSQQNQVHLLVGVTF